LELEKKKIIAKMLRAENERRLEAEKLKQELREQESRGEQCDINRVMEIIEELSIIDPPLEGESGAEGVRWRGFRLLSSAAKRAIVVCVILAVILPVFAITAFNNNFFGNVRYYTQMMFSGILGKNVQQDNVNRWASDAKEYKNIEEFELAENIKLLIPSWLPGDLEIKNIRYSYDNNEETTINIKYHNEKTLLTIKFNTLYTIDEAEIYENNGVIFYLFKDSDMICWEYGGNFYTLDCGFDINEYAEEIIKNIK
jgi:hypothetical protein